MIRLENGEYTAKAPYGLKKVNYNGNPREHKKQPTILAQNEFIPHIKKVFEMKVAGKTAKEISKYLKQYGGFYISAKRIVETIISNTVYKGWYTDESSEKVFKIKFWEGKAPIEESLWQKANNTVGKRGNGFGKGQNEHIFVGKIKSDIGTSFQVYIAAGKTGKGKHYNYKGTTKDETGKINNIYISETNILEYLVKEIRKVSDAIMKKIQLTEDLVLARNIHESLKQEIRMIPEMVHLTDEELDMHVSNLINGFEDYITAKGASASGSQLDGQFVDVLRGEVESNYSQEEKSIVEFGLTKDKVQRMDDDQFGHTQDLRDFLEIKMKLRDKIIAESLQSSPYLHKLQSELELQQKAIQQLEEQKKQLEKELEGIYDSCFEKGFDKSFGDRQAQKMKERLDGLDRTIDELKNNENLHTILQKLPIVLSKIVELSSGALGKAKIKESREEIKLILEIIAVELQINNKKELKIKLFEGLDGIIDDEN